MLSQAVRKLFLHLPARFLLLLAGSALYPSSRAHSQNLQEQTSIVVAFVFDTAGRPISGAEVHVVGTGVKASSDDRGRVALLAVPTGKATLRFRRLGFAERTVHISVTPGMPDSSYMMTPVATDLKDVVVKASSIKPDRYAKTRKFDGFYQRRSQGSGTFVTREMIDARSAQKSEDLLRFSAGVRVRYRGTVPAIQFHRCGRVNVYIDGIRSHDPARDFFNLSPLQIEAMEIYNGMTQLPPEFALHSEDCAAIVVWTRWNGA